jgi:hypothetical protein
MRTNVPKLVAVAALGALTLALIGAGTTAQEPIPLFPPGGAQPPGAQPADAQPDGADVLARGPVHEAFATSAEAAVPGPVVTKRPPEPIEELPPDQKPDGDNVQWIPGYWHWDDDGEQFLWISGCWRDTPPGRLWVPGSWREVRDGWQWAPGFWQEPDRDEPTQPEISYLPEPPATLEIGPAVAAPNATSFYVPGSWVWRNKYVWRPGVWVEYRTNWVWVPAHYRWTPLGFVFVDGYWDYALARRGVLFAPVTFARPVRPAFVYTPVYVVSEPALVGALFVRRGYGNYYFGDYFDRRYVGRGFNPWAGRVAGVTFTIGFGTGRNWGYDPLWSYYSYTRRADRDWNTRVNDLYVGRYAGKVARPPVNLTQQNTVINNITNTTVNNVTNNVTVVNRTVTVNKQNVTDVAMLAPARVAPALQPEAQIKAITPEVRRSEATAAKQTRDFGAARQKAEAAALAKQPAPQPGVQVQPKSLKLEVPKAVAAKAQVKDEKKAPPPPAVKPEPRPNVKIDPKPKVDPKPKDPDPKPKVDPKPKDPDPKPKVDPKPKDPDPKPKDPDPKPKDPAPDPKPKVDPPPKPKVDPPKVDPPPKPKVDPPKVDPPKKEPPKVEPPKKEPPKKEPPKKDEKKNPPPGAGD